MFRIIILKQHKFSQSDPVLIRQFSKNGNPIQSCSCQNWRQSCSSPIQSRSVLISASDVCTYCSGVQDPDLESNPARNLDFFEFGLDIVSLSTGSDLDYPIEIKWGRAKNVAMEQQLSDEKLRYFEIIYFLYRRKITTKNYDISKSYQLVRFFSVDCSVPRRSGS